MAQARHVPALSWWSRYAGTRRGAGSDVVAVLLAARRCARAPRLRIYLEDLTWTELRDRIAAGATTAIIPIGGTEQSGPAIALGKHNVRVKILAGQIAGALGNAIVAPVVAYVPEGTISRRPAIWDFPERSRSATRLRGRPRIGSRKPAARRLHHHRPDRRSRRLPGGREHRWPTSSTPHWASNARPRLRRPRTITGSPRTDMSKNCAPPAFAATEIGTHAGLADTSLMLRPTRRWCAPTCSPATPSPPKTACSTAIPGEPAGPRPIRRRPHRSRPAVADIRAFIAKQQE